MSTIKHMLGKLIPERIRPAVRAAISRYQDRGFKPYVKKMKADDLSFDFWISDHVGQTWYEGGWFSPEARFLRDTMVKPGDVVFECGAHQGCHTVLCSHWVGTSGRVVAFEMLPRNADAVQKNIELNHLVNVVLEKKAVGSSAGKALITDESNSHVLSGKGKGIEVETTYLDLYAHLNPTLLKIDVEGFEVEVLKGASHILSKRPKLAIEIHTEHLKNYRTSVDEVFNLIRSDGYTIWIQWDDTKMPELWNGKQSITKRAHLFALPRD